MATAAPRPLVAGNWKMNGLAASVSELGKIAAGAAPLAGKADLLICPPATLLASFAVAARGSAVAIGGQDCHAEASGAHTGDVAAEMLRDAGATAVIQPGGSLRDPEVIAAADAAGIAMVFTGMRHFRH